MKLLKSIKVSGVMCHRMEQLKKVWKLLTDAGIFNNIMRTGLKAETESLHIRFRCLSIKGIFGYNLRYAVFNTLQTLLQYFWNTQSVRLLLQYICMERTVMTDDDVTKLLTHIRTEIKKENLTITYLSKHSEVTYNSVKNFLDDKTDPLFRTVVRLIDASDLPIATLFNEAAVSDEKDPSEDFYARKMKRLNAYNKAITRLMIDMLTERQEKEARHETLNNEGI